MDASTGASPEAEVTLTDPAPGDYRVFVHAPRADDRPGRSPARCTPGWSPAAARRPVTLSTDAVGFAPGQRFRYSASWTGLDPTRATSACVTYGDPTARTLLEVN